MQRKLDLRGGKPVWHAYRAPVVPVDKLTRDIRTEVLVVGMGISGAMIAEELATRGHQVVMIDRRGPMLGSTAATTALVQFEIDNPLSTLSRKIGRDNAERAWRRSRLAVANLQGHIEQSGVNCRMTPRVSLYLAGTEMSGTGLQQEAAARRQAGIAAEYLSPAALKEAFGITRDGAILSTGNLSLDPRMLAAGLLLRAAEHKARLYAPAEAIGVEHHSDGVFVATRSGQTIHADDVILATGYELLDVVPAKTHEIISTWAIATRRQPEAIWPRAAFIWEASDPYLYMRATADGRVICGGEDESFVDEEKRDAMIVRKAERISAKLGRLFPQIDAMPDYSWAGAFGTTTTGLPIIGQVPYKPRLFAVLGYGGNGITYSRIASEIIGTALDGRDDSDSALFKL